MRNCWMRRLRVNRIVAAIANDVRLFPLSRSRKGNKIAFERRQLC